MQFACHIKLLILASVNFLGLTAIYLWIVNCEEFSTKVGCALCQQQFKVNWMRR